MKMKFEEREAHLKIHNLLIFAFYRSTVLPVALLMFVQTGFW
jgi:hypothetical protein